MERDRNLLFGVFAVQLKLVTPQKLVEAAGSWATNQEKHLGDILAEIGAIAESDKELIEDLIKRQIEMHNGDAGEVLNSFGGERAVHETFAASIAIKGQTVEFISLGRKADDNKVYDDILSDSNLTVEHPGKYTIKGEHGRGGIGRVLIAMDTHIGRDIAVKELLPDPATGKTPTPGSDESPMRQTAAAAVRFLREARITGKLEHPGIVPVYELGKRSDGTIYYTMRLVRGQTLAQAIEGRSLSERLKLLPHFLDLCHTVAYAHSTGVIHRDIKPQNVMIGEFGETVLLDWGLGKAKGSEDLSRGDLQKELDLLKSESGDQTVAGTPIGTPSYMSPEQADGKIDEIDERSDIWSLGAVLFEIVTGKRPFTGFNAFEIIGKVLIKEPDLDEDEKKQYPKELISICFKCLNKKKGDRYKNAKLLAEDVRNFQTGGLVLAYDYSIGLMVRRWVLKHKTIFVSSFILLFLIILAGAISFSFWKKAEKQKNIAEKRRIELEIKRRSLSTTLSSFLTREGDRAFDENKISKALLLYKKSLDVQDNFGTRIKALKAMESVRPEMFTLKGHKDVVTCIALSHNGRLLSSGSTDGTVKIWDFKTGEIVKDISLPPDTWPNDLTFSPSNDVLAFSLVHYPYSDKYHLLEPNSIHIYYISNGKEIEIKSKRDKGSRIKNIVFNKNGQWLASAGRFSCLIYKKDNIEEKLDITLKLSSPESISFVDDSDILALGTKGGIVFLDLNNNFRKRILKIPYHTSLCHGYYNSKGTKFLVSGGEGDIIYVQLPNNLYELFNEKTKLSYNILEKTDYAVTTLSTNSNSQQIAWASNNDRIVYLYHMIGEKIEKLVGHESFITDISFSRDGKQLISSSEDGTIRSWIIEKEISKYNELHFKIKEEKDVEFLDISSDGKYLAAISTDTINIWNVNDHKNINVLNSSSNDVLAFSPDGEVLALGEHNRHIKILNIKDGEIISKFDGSNFDDSFFCFSPDSSILAVPYTDGHIKFWEVSTGKLVTDLKGSDNKTIYVDYSPDGKLFATSGKVVKLWDVSSIKDINLLKEINVETKSVKFSPDGKFLAFHDADKIKLYDVKNDKISKVMKSNQQMTPFISFGPKGNYLFTLCRIETQGPEDFFKFILWEIEKNSVVYESAPQIIGTWPKISADWSLIAFSTQNTIKVLQTGYNNIDEIYKQIKVYCDAGVSYTIDDNLNIVAKDESTYLKEKIISAENGELIWFKDGGRSQVPLLKNIFLSR
jgi:eukaryotic-like serine/threonine-protein kinase